MLKSPLLSGARFLARFLREKWGSTRERTVSCSHKWIKQTLVLTLLFLLTACSPRDYLTRRLASDLISNSDSFKAPQKFLLQTGIVTSKEYPSPEYLVLQHHGWISANTVACTPGLAPAPCWDIALTPAGIDIIRNLIAPEQAGSSSRTIPAARRELVDVTGISKQGSLADVEFTWKWVPLNEIGNALYTADLHYQSTVGFRQFDDGWRVIERDVHSAQTLNDALKNAEPAP
jgi:hypothetical protein